MDDLWTSDPLAFNTYFNCSLVFRLRMCQPTHSPPLTAMESEVEEGGDTEEADTGDFSFSLNDVASWLISGEGREEERPENDHHHSMVWETGDNCQDLIDADLGGAVLAASLVMVVLGLVIVLSVSLVLLSLLRKKLSVLGEKESSAGGVKTKEAKDVHEKEEEVGVSSIGSVGPNQTLAPDLSSIAAGRRPQEPVVIPLAGGGQGIHGLDPQSLMTTPDSSQFLRHTVDHLLTQLDWLLGVGGGGDDSSPSTPPLSATASSVVTPRLQRKGSIRRPRWRTLTSLPMESTSSSPDDKTAVRMWQKVADMERKMSWAQTDTGDLDISAIQDSRLSAALQFHQQACPVRVEQWSASCLIVNYVLTLLQQELAAGTTDRSVVKVLELRSFGSARAETCISRANRFNVMLVLHLPFCTEMSVHDCEVCDDIPAGKLVLGVKEGGGGGASTLVQKDRVGDSFGSFLSVREVTKACQKLLVNTMDRLKLKNKLLLDRLSFSMHLDQYSDLLLCIDTRLLNGMGLGLSEITLRLTPALRVSSEENYPLPVLYAVPPWNCKPVSSSDGIRSRVQSRIMRSHNQGVPPDLLWQLNGCELTEAFMSVARDKLTSTRVVGCQVICQQILRAVFSRSGKDMLLTTGELHPHVLDSVIFFLLLESPASSWNLQCLPDRFSDCVHFLRSAVQSSWMPGFLLHNPHLLKQMPALQLLPLLRSRRQENLLASVGPEESENVLSFMESRLQETGLRRCIKEDYSTEMWEYEFFIFG
ncbi:uncharacterized protein LOC143281912 [Babylonia areolata]|uniref:uncharacterized protein LOC143281912 n=1 Tax=Babylonia areolata TaxID=304850 RepID=UPI003FD4CFF1